MKKFKITPIAFVLSLFTVSIAFADNYHDDKKVKKDKNKEASSFDPASNHSESFVSKEIKAPFIFEEVEDEPVFDAAIVKSLVKDSELIKVKVFDEKGNLIDEENVSMHELMSTNFAANKLPVNSSFLMFFENTAYYIIH